VVSHSKLLEPHKLRAPSPNGPTRPTIKVGGGGGREGGVAQAGPLAINVFRLSEDFSRNKFGYITEVDDQLYPSGM